MPHGHTPSVLLVRLGVLLAEQQTAVQTEGVSGSLLARAGAADKLVAAGPLLDPEHEREVLRQEVVGGVVLEEGALSADRDGAARQVARLRIRALVDAVLAHGVEAVEQN